jgi:hypothetical protein
MYISLRWLEWVRGVLRVATASEEISGVLLNTHAAPRVVERKICGRRAVGV